MINFNELNNKINIINIHHQINSNRLKSKKKKSIFNAQCKNSPDRNSIISISVDSERSFTPTEETSKSDDEPTDFEIKIRNKILTHKAKAYTNFDQIKPKTPRMVVKKPTKFDENELWDDLISEREESDSSENE